MKIIFIIIALSFLNGYAVSQNNVGINNDGSTPHASALLHLNTGTSLTKGLLVNGTFNNSASFPNLGMGTRMMFYPGKSAFRAGTVNANQWDNSLVGDFSFGVGNNVIALGDYSFAAGNMSTASGLYAVSMGIQNDASGESSFAIGRQTSASDKYSVAMGSGTTSSGLASLCIGLNSSATADYTLSGGFLCTASGNSSVALGAQNLANGQYAVAIGVGNTASAEAAIALGYFNTAASKNSLALGRESVAKGYSSTVVGVYNDSILASNELFLNYTSPLFIVGNGDGNLFGQRANALVVQKSGKVFIDPSDKNDGNDDFHALLFGGGNSGEGIGSKRTSGGHQYSLNFYSNHQNRMTILNNGNIGIGNTNPSQKLEVNGNITVQNGKGLIRNIDGTQSKKLSTSVTVNASFAAGETKVFAITWPESFSASPEAYVGNVTGGAGGWAEVIMTISNVGTSGATLYVYNPRSVSANPNFTVKVIAIGAQ